ncbi:MAG: hypothetical protein ACRDOS_10615 [Gaiellaceae bacterium]
MHLFEADNRSAARLYREALAEADAKSSVRADAEGGLAVALMRMLDDLPAAARHARAAAELAERLGEPRDAAEFLGDEALILGLLGRPAAAAVMDGPWSWRRRRETLPLRRRASSGACAVLPSSAPCSFSGPIVSTRPGPSS